MEKNILISGFGGQGMMSLGKILAEAALFGHKYVSWFPSYGAEMRGGTAHCFVKISNRPISSPFVSLPDIAIIFNRPSLEKFKNNFTKNTLLIINSDLVKLSSLENLVIAPGSGGFPFNKIALNCGNLRVANTVALGIMLFLTKDFVRKKDVVFVLKKKFSDTKKQKQNLKALAKGENYVKS